MKKSIRPLLIMGVAAGLALSLHSKASAQSPAQFMVTIGGDTFDLSQALTIDFQTNTFRLPQQVLFGGNGEQVIVSAGGKIDPTLTFAFGVVNPLSTPDTFGLFFDVPIVGLTPGSPVLITSTLSGSVTDGGDGSVTLTPSLAFTDYARVNGAIAGPGIGGTQTSGAGSTPYGSLAGFSSSFISAPPVNTLGVNILFTLTGGNDAASFTGSITAVDVPEPGVVALLIGFGTCSSLLAARRLRKRA